MTRPNWCRSLDRRLVRRRLEMRRARQGSKAVSVQVNIGASSDDLRMGSALESLHEEDETHRDKRILDRGRRDVADLPLCVEIDTAH